MSEHPYAIITTDDEIEESRYKHKFQTGLNICPHNHGFCIHATSAIPKRLPIHINDKYIRFVEFPSDSGARIADNTILFPDNCQLYANKIIASERIPLADYITADMVKQHHINLQHIPKERRTYYSMYLDAIRGCYAWIKEMPEQTDEACLLAVQEHSDALLYIKKLTPELCHVAFETAKKNQFYNTQLCCPWRYIIRERPEILRYLITEH
jgi:hypothetical protein